MSHTITLRQAQQGHEVINNLWAWMRPRLMSGQALTLSVEEERRSLPQNALLHALLTDISKRREWAGKKRDAECWKRLCVAAWCRARGEAVELLPALDGHGVDVVFRKTSKMTKAEVRDLIDFIQAWDAQQ